MATMPPPTSRRPRSAVWAGEELAPADAARRLHELSALFEVARQLIGARDARDVGTRLVHSSMGALGARSGAFLLAHSQGRYQAAYASGPAEAGPGELLELPERARQWALRQGVFLLSGPDAHVLGAARERLVGCFDGSVAAALRGSEGLEGLLVLGPRLISEDYTEDDLELVSAFAGLGERALEAGAGAAEIGAVEVRAPGRHATAKLEALRRRYPPLRPLVGSSAALLECCQELLAVAPTECTVLLQGESGVGKELAARAIHELSARAAAPFEVIDCGSIPKELIESELFGHVRGAFTGATKDRRGAFELAHRGTLFLDEIGEMPLQSQTRLLRVLQEGRFRRVGDERNIDVNVRVVAATNRDLRQDVANHRFREDLFYRVNVFPVRVPPLRERNEDIPELLLYFLDQRAQELGRGGFKVRTEVVDAVLRCPFPGNVRELANLAAALAVSAREDERITMGHLERIWRRHHKDEPPPWEAAPKATRQDLGSWVLHQVRAARFNLVEAERRLRREQWRAGKREAVPLCERSALGYYLQGEMLRALVDCEGDADQAASRLVADDEDLAPRVKPRLTKLVDELRAAAASGARGEALERQFGKLPRVYADALHQAARLMS